MPELPDAPPVVTAESITDAQILALFARHCECRPVDVFRASHSHDCYSSITYECALAMGGLLIDGNPVMAGPYTIRHARRFLAEFLNSHPLDLPSPPLPKGTTPPMTAPHVITQRTVPLSQLWLDAPNWTNPRTTTGLDDNDIAELGQRIKVNGITAPLVVQKILVNGEVHDLVIDGQRRHMGATLVLAKNAPIPVVDLTEDAIELTPENADRLLEKAMATTDRENLSSFELSAVAEKMKVRGKTLEQISATIRKDKSWISKMLKARGTASPKLMLKWRKGDVTDEQFKDLAEIGDVAEQDRGLKEVTAAHKDGDRGEARVRAKELAASAKQKTAGKDKDPHPVTNGVNKRPVVAGPQVDLFERESQEASDAAAKAPPKKTPMAPRAVLEDIVAMADQRPPTSDYVKGVIDATRHALGTKTLDTFSKAWAQYVTRVSGIKPTKAAKAKKSAKKVHASAKRRLAKPAKMRTARPKKSAGKKKAK